MPSAFSSRVRASIAGFTGRRPSFVPLAFALARPAFTRSRIESSEGNATEKVVAFLHHQSLLGVSDRGNMLLIILMSLEFEDGPVARKVKALYRKFYDGLNNVIRDGQKDGEFRTDVPSRELAAIIAAKPPAAIQGTVKAIWQSLDMGRNQALAMGVSYTLIGNPIGTAEVDRATATRPEWTLR